MNVNKVLLKSLLKELCEINGASGAEDRVRKYILEKIGGRCKCHITPLGCIIAEYKGRKTSSEKLMISAHMDEVALIITDINSDGTLSFNCVGGVEPDVTAGRQVVLENGMNGVVGSRAVHNLTADERKSPLRFDDLYIDIGAADKENALKYVSLGDYAYFVCGYSESASGFIMGKAIDDRAGCAVMLAMIMENAIEYDCVFSFVVQEEIGLRGAKTAAYEISPDFAMVLEATTASDTPLSKGAKRCCEVGKGPVVSYMDRATVYDRELFEMTKTAAADIGVSWQTKTLVAGGNDSGAIHISKSGVKTISLSLPCRYLHSPSGVICEKDYFEAYELSCETAKRILEGRLS